MINTNYLQKKVFSVKYYSFEEMIKSRGFLVYTNVGTSMLPLLRQRRDIIEIRSIKGRIRKYQVALYKKDGAYILHRCLAVLPDGAYIFAGDHNTYIEKDVTDTMILGVMTRVIRNGKSITPNNFFYKVYVHLWCDFYPIRMMIIKFKQRIQKILSGIKRRVT